MEILKNNFTERLDDIAEAIDQATFLTIDGEFTGLDKPGCNHSSPFDSPAERYIKVRESSMDFLLVQFGLCAFKYEEETQSYEARPFNFYIFPRPHSRQAPDRRFICQSSSIDFLVQQGFDFNKLFREGIPYLTPSQEETMREALQMKHEAFSKFSSPSFVSPDGADAGPGKGPIQIPEEQKPFVEDVCDKISNFMEDTGESDVLQLAPCNGFQRKLIYQTVRSKFSSVHLETKTGEKKERFIVVTKVASDEELKKKEEEKQNADFMELDEAVGFAKVIKYIMQSGKIVVGHNMILDLMHMLNQFCHQLPEELDEFKSLVQCCFPRLLDTKMMASTHPLRDVIPRTDLENLRHIVEKDPFTPPKVVLPEEFKRYEDVTDKYHEAGFDAYVTGCIFATMTNFIGKSLGSEKPVVEPTPDLLKPFMNKLFLMKIPDIPFMNLAGPDLEPNRDHVFHLTFRKDWKASDINNIFSQFGNIQISWLSDTSAFVSLYKKENANLVMKALGDTRVLYRLIPYKEYKSTIAAGSQQSPATPKPSPSLPQTAASRTGLKRPAAASDGGDDADSPQMKKKLCSAGAVGVTATEKQDKEMPDIESEPQVDKKPSDGEGASSGLFTVPDDW